MNRKLRIRNKEESNVVSASSSRKRDRKGTKLFSDKYISIAALYLKSNLTNRAKKSANNSTREEMEVETSCPDILKGIASSSKVKYRTFNKSINNSYRKKDWMGEMLKRTKINSKQRAFKMQELRNR